jgi:hypothetical protein
MATFWWIGIWLVGHRNQMSFDCFEILYSATRTMSLSCPNAALRTDKDCGQTQPLDLGHERCVDWASTMSVGVCR